MYGAVQTRSRRDDVVKCLVGEAPALMAVDALRLADEQLEAGELVGIDGVRIARHPAIEPRFGGHEGPLETGQRRPDMRLPDLRLLGERRGEAFHRGRVRRKTGARL